MLTRQQKKTITTVAWFTVPTILIFLLVSVGLTLYTVQYITHPKKNPSFAATVKDYELLGILITQSEESWNLKNRGGQATGWLLRASTGAPAIILSHSLGQNRADLLSLGVGLQRAGYHVLLYDLRAQGTSGAEMVTYGDYESEDILAAIEHLKTLKDTEGNLLVDQERFGLYGVSIGGYASLVAASKEPAVKAVVVDAVYPDVKKMIKLRTKAMIGFNNSLIDSCLDMGMGLAYTNYATTSAIKSVRGFTETKQLYILGKDAGDLLMTTSEVYGQALGSKETVEVPHSRLNVLYKNDQDVYDPVVVDFFRRPDVLPPIPASAPEVKTETETKESSTADANEKK
ncbi:MAG: alpha/beta fold hydrolase [Blastocatellia bacterium]|nr:alpha/beta fold hydrolase [Blastocatellia bacterium]